MLNRTIWLGLAGCFTLAGLAAGYLSSEGVSQAKSIRRLENPRLSQEKVLRPSARELVLAYIGSSTCGWSGHSELPELLAKAVYDIRVAARKGDASFATVGIAVDWSLQSGLAHLSRFNAFDEISVGRKWYSSAVQQYTAGDLPGPLTTPQLVVVERHRSTDPATGDVAPRFREQQLLTRKIGVDAIRDWVHAGSPLP